MKAGILLAAGASERFAASCPPEFPPAYRNKLRFPLPDGREVWRWSFDLLREGGFDKLIVVTGDPDIARAAETEGATVARGGSTRGESCLNGLRAALPVEVAVIHDAARPFATPNLLMRVLLAAEEHGAAVPVIPIPDTVKRCTQQEVLETVDRSQLRLAQTPQAADAGALLAALEKDLTVTDEAAALEKAGIHVAPVEGELTNRKITTYEDLRGTLDREVRVGTGYDVHRFGGEGPIWLGGVEIPSDLGLIGHSDADAVLHAVTDALLGAVAAGDIGRHFPDTDPALAGARSDQFVRYAAEQVRALGFWISHIDITVLAQHPKIAPHAEAIRESIAQMVGVEPGRISIKATTHEGLGAIGRGEGIAAMAVATIERLRLGSSH